MATAQQLKALRRKHHLGEFRRSTKRTHSIKSKMGVKMARRRRGRSRGRSFGKSKLFGLGGIVVGAIAYGAVRSKISTALMPVTAKIPLGSISDEVGMLVTLTLAKKFIGHKVPLVSQICTAGQYIELARIGEEIANGTLSFGNAPTGVTYSYFS